MNYRLYFNIFLFILLAFLIVIFQYSYISLFYYPFYLFDLIIPTIVFLFLIAKLEFVWTFSIASALLLDFLAFNSFIINTFSIILVVFLIQNWLRNWITNFSLYSFLALSVAAIFIKNIIYYVFILIFKDTLFSFFNLSFWLDLGWQILFSLILVTIFFYIALRVNKRLRPAFLGRKPLS